MKRRFDKPGKPIAFDDRGTCQVETNRLIIDNVFNKTRPAVAIIILDTPEEIKKYIYPRIEHFHKSKQSKHGLSQSNLFKPVVDDLLSMKRLSIYDQGSKQAAYNTINYMLDEFRQCIFVQILDNKIYTFAQLNHYSSDQSHTIAKLLKVDPSKYKSIGEFTNRSIAKLNKNMNITKQKEDSIYFTDCSVKLWNVRPDAQSELEVDSHYTYIYHLLEELLANRKIDDTEFIYNHRDLNVLLQDGVSSPHYNILGSFTKPLQKKYSPFIPILNFNKHKRFADIPVPTNDDWEIITNKIFLGKCRDLYFNIDKHLNHDWDSKIPTAIFRGGATGCGVKINDNPRLKAVYLAAKNYKSPKYGINNQTDGKLYLDARLVSFKTHVKKHYSNKYIDVIDPTKLPFRLGKKMSLGAISNYKYILSIEGNVAQFRLTLELGFNSVVLLVKSDQYIWYQPLLVPWVHYVPVKADLSDLMDRIHWCKTHDDKCKEIAANAMAFYKKYITQQGAFDYMEAVFNYH